MVEPPVIARHLVEAELDRLMDSPSLRRAPSHMRLLRYLVARRLAQDDPALRETAIAIEVFRRDPSTYDPQTDPIVRVTTRRLRERLEAAYAGRDTEPAVRILLPKGRYAPEFVARPGAAASRLGLLVLRTRNQTGEAGLDPRCDAFADRLRDHLAHAGLPHVHAAEAPSDRVAEVRAGGPPMPGIAWLLESTLACEHERELRLSVRLLHATDQTLRWVETAVAQAREVASLFERMLDFVLIRTLDTLPLPAAMAAGATAPGSTTLPRAQRIALDQVPLMLAQRNLRGTEDAVAIAQAAVHTHPQDADAWATHAAALYSRYSFMDREEGALLDEMRASIGRALALAPEHPVALRTKAIVTGKCDYDAVTAEDLFRRALRSMPHYTSARINLAELLAFQGKAAEAQAELNLARVYDPLSPSVLLARAVCLDMLRRFEASGEAWALCAATGEASLWVLCGTGMHHLLVGELARATQCFDEAESRHSQSPMAAMGRAYVLALTGDAAAAHDVEAACRARFAHVSPASRALLAAWLGERERMVALLTQARAARDMELVQTAIHPALDAFAHDAEVQRLLPLGGYAGLR